MRAMRPAPRDHSARIIVNQWEPGVSTFSEEDRRENLFFFLFNKVSWLVVGLNPSEKYEFVNWDDEIPNIWENKKWQPNHQPVPLVFLLLTLSVRNKKHLWVSEPGVDGSNHLRMLKKVLKKANNCH